MSTLSRNSKKDSILLAAKLVFLERGYDGASMDLVAERAETTKRTVYNHFRSKEDLFRAIVQKIGELFFSKLTRPDPDGELAEELEMFAARYCELCTWTVAVQFQRLVIAEQNRFPELQKFASEEIIGRSEAILADYLAELVAKKQLKLSKPLAASRLFLNMSTGGQRFETLIGAVKPIEGPPGDTISAAVDRAPIRAAVNFFLKAAR